MTIWAFANVKDDDWKAIIHKSILNGKSRFGWSWEESNNLLDPTNRKDKKNSKLLFLLRIRKDDWIVHVHLPEYGECIAVKVTGEYRFEGFECKMGTDFRSAIPVDKDSVVVFNRNDPNIDSAVNLKPLRRFHRVLAEKEFFQSLEKIKKNQSLIKNG